jgi:hypothetical protein
LPQVLAAFDNEQAPFGLGTIDLLGTLAERASPRMKREMVALIVRKIRSSDADEGRFRASAASALLSLGTEIEPAIPILKRLVIHGSQEVYSAALALAQHAPDGPVFLGHLLNVPHASNRESILRALAAAGPRASEALTALHCLVDSDDDARLRLFALSIIERIDPEHPIVDETFRQELYRLRNPNIRFLVREQLNWPYDDASLRSPEARRCMRYFLMKDIHDPNINARIAAVRQLAAHGAEAREAAPELWRLSKSADRFFRAYLIDALWRIDTASERNGLLRDPRAQLVAAIKRDLWRYGEGSHMIEFLPHLPEIERQGVSLVPELIRLSHAKRNRVAQNALSTLRAIGPAAKNAIPDLIQLMDKVNVSTQRAAILALLTIGRGHPLAVQRLRDWCETEGPDIITELKPTDLGKEEISSILLKFIRDNPTQANDAIELLKATDPDAAKKLDKQ